ncbi:MAG: biotin biosynthesis protein BioC [Bacilli bacterium]|nr:biotin biosynthesis protein BioC [Bacilli bacterium]
MIDKRLVRKHFSLNAKQYDRYAEVQRYLADRLIERLTAKAGQCQLILEIGCGTGYLTKQLLNLYPDTKVVAVDLSEPMLEVAKDTVGYSGQVEFLCQDVESIELPNTFDLIVSSAVFQWLNDPFGTLGRLDRLLGPGGQMQFATFGNQTFRELHESFALAEQSVGNDPTEAHGQQFLAMDNWQEFLSLLDYQDVDGVQEIHEVEYPNVRSFLDNVRKTGANNATRTKQSIAVHRQILLKMMQEYEQQFRKNNGICATYDLLIVGGRKRA